MDGSKKAKEVLAQLTLEEKASLCSGGDFWHTKSIERLGVPKMMLTDGPHGLRKQAGNTDQLGISDSVPATCFPPACATACSFDPALLREMGAAIGEECQQEGVGVILGPGANIKRSPLCGRNFEYFSEDPCLSGTMAAALIEGIQGKGAGASLKHFAANNQETRRLTIDAVIDERALRELFLASFEAAVKQGDPWTVMCSYNQVNGEYACQNHRLLTEILRDEWGFPGLVVSDWGATVDRAKGVAAGMDLEMPWAGPYHDADIVKAVQNGTLSEETLDTAVLRILDLVFKAAEQATGAKCDMDGHHALARRIAMQSAVLLKNDSLLPLSKDKKIALLGAFAEQPRYQGAGSSRINPQKLDTLCGALDEKNIRYTYAAGYAGDTPDEALLREAEHAAKGADVAVVCIGLPDSYESEGFDRDHLRLPDSHIALLQRAAAANPNTVALLFCGGVVEMPWISSARALLLLYLGGEAGSLAAADLLFGDAVPSGKLAETWPLHAEDAPCHAYFPGNGKTVEYRESIYVGYRYYDKAQAEVRFPFGYGLSYTTFAYSEFSAKKEGEEVHVFVNVKNTGDLPGGEIVQFYVSQDSPSVFKPVRELKAFQKVWLEPGEEKAVCVALPPRAFAFYDVDHNDFRVETGDYKVSAAACSRDIRCELSVFLDGQPRKSAPIPPEYVTPKQGGFTVSDAAFVALLGHPLPPSVGDASAPFTVDSTLGEIAQTQAGQQLIAQIRQQLGGVAGDSEGVGLMFEKMVADMPLRSLLLFSGGQLSPDQLAAIAAGANAETGRG